MLTFPSVTECASAPGLVVTSQIPGGASKTWSATIAIDAAVRSGCDLAIFENDRQDILSSYASVTQVRLAPTEEVVHNATADIEAHRDFDAAVRGLVNQPDLTVFYDTSAASLNRVSFVFDMLNIADRLAAMGRYCLILVPVSARLDIARDALITHDVWRSLMPAPHLVVPVVFHRDGDPHRVSPDHPLRQLVKRAEDGFLVQPRVPMQVLLAHKRSGMRLFELADLRDPLATDSIAQRAGLDPTATELLRRSCADLLAEMDPQFARLGFQLGA